MIAKILTMRAAQKAAATAMVCGLLSLGSAGVASAATTATTTGPTTTGSVPTGSAPAAHRFTCSRAPKALARITRVENTISRHLPKWEAAEQKATSAGHTKIAARIEKRIHRLQKIDSRIGTLSHKIEAKCPTGAPGANSTPS